jgi:nicotinate-nucleotide--dimethylbenzimidazole phosphoribosyltransferase
MISPAVTQLFPLISPLFDEALATALTRRWQHLAKLPGSLGRLEDLVLHFGLVKRSETPSAARRGLIVFAAEHAVADRGVGREAPGNTRRLVRQFLRGGTAANAVCREAQIEALLVDAGLRGDPEPGALPARAVAGSADITLGPALTVGQANAALEAGIALARDAAARFDVVGVGQVGVGAECAASAILSALSGREAIDTVAREPGLEEMVYFHRLQSVRSALVKNQLALCSPFGVLCSVGGPDLAVLTGFLLGAASQRLPVLVDGFVCGAAALLARSFAPDTLDALMFAHLEPTEAHAYLLRFLAVEPLLKLELSEPAGFGAALGLQLLSTSLRLANEIRGVD